jgi:ketosteroid isomerase-like protein
MSQENVETLHRGMDAFNRRDRTAWLALCDTEYETVPSDDWPEIEPIRGPEAVWDFYVQADEPWEKGDYECVDVLDAGNDRVVARMWRRARGKASGASVDYSYWVVVTFRKGKLFRIRWFEDRKAGLEAVGLSEQDAPADS